MPNHPKNMNSDQLRNYLCEQGIISENDSNHSKKSGD